MRVLITESNPAQAQQLAGMLEAEGYEVTSAPNGRQALVMARLSKPNLVISDVVMPEMSGYELCAQIKGDEQLGDVPVILATTLSDPQDLPRALECRADNFVFKPYDAKNLIARVQSLLNRPPGQSQLLLSTLEAALHRNRELEQNLEALRQSQNALIQQERLRALGQMASGIAHDINNAISPISLYTETLLEREQLGDKARGYLNTIQHAIEDVAQTVGRLRDFYRPREPEPQLSDVELNPLIQQVIEVTRSRWGDRARQHGVKIEVVPALAEKLATIRGAENEIRDAITNLVFNAVDALPQGGSIQIRTRNIASQATPGAKPAVQLEVSDTGVGMDEDTRRRCVEPFFTTKGERGAGLGLAMVHGMARRHGAGLDIDSTPGKGTTVRITFRSGAAPSAGSGRQQGPLLATRALRVLLVDDDPALLESLRSSLQDEGHKVTATNGGQAGIDAFREGQRNGKLFDIVITDLSMPYVDGRQVIAGVRAVSPLTPIILLTGWGQHAVNDQDHRPEVDRVLGKPPRIRELRAALAELTGRRATDRRG